MKKTLLLLLLSAKLFFSQATSDIVNPLTVFTGEEKNVLIGDLFFAENYDAKVSGNETLTVLYDKETKTIKITPNNNSAGFTSFPVILENDTIDVPVIIKKNYPVKFNFPAKRKYKFVSVFGSFNDWNRREFPMKLDGDFYTVTVPLRAGNYQYKFFVDGKEYCDPANPDSVGNGMGGFNSALEIKSRENGEFFLHKLRFENRDGKTTFSFALETSKNSPQISKGSVFVFLDNKLIDGSKISVKNDTIKISFGKNEIKRSKRLRVVVSENGVISNIQNVFLERGKPKSVADNFDWRRGIIYSLMIDRFYDGDKSNSLPIKHDSLFAKANYMGGDLQGIIDKLDAGYFDSLGINVLWISPVYDNPNKAFREYPPPHRWFSGYHGYWPVNSFGVDEHFGSLELLKALTAIAHEHGIKVLLDFVSNHVHIENPLYSEHRNWFGSLYLPDGRKNIRFWDEYRLTTWFEPYLPSFDYLGSDEAVEFMTDNALWWLQQSGADGFRHDAVKHVPNKFWRRLTSKLKAAGYKNIYQIGETFGSDVLVSSYVNNGQLSGQFNFNLYNTALETFIDSSRSFENLLTELKTTFSYYGENNLMGNIMDSHDKNRFMAFADGDLTLEQWSAAEEGWNNPPKVDHASSYKKAELYYAYMFAISGIPVIYYGSEFGMTGASDPDNRRMMRFGNDLTRLEKNMLGKTSLIVKLRRNNSALNYGDFYPLTAGKNIFAFVRSDFNQRVLVVMNKSFDKTENVKLKLPEFYLAKKIINLANGKIINCANDEIEIAVEPLGWRYYLIK